MQITIDTTQPLDATDVRILNLLLDEKQGTKTTVTEPAVKPEPAKRPAAKPAPKPAEPEPEEETEEDLLGDELGKAVTREDVVKAATAIVKDGGQDKIRAALKQVKAAKVSALPDEKLAEFHALITA